ncbi:HET-domain-containing protein [Cadophora sp. DSE1049]|nr:HET-domain-containing protein [Cadophora sp. DSE1049]
MGRPLLPSDKDQQPAVPDFATPTPESSKSNSEPQPVPDVDSDADSDTDARDLIKELIENVGSEVFEQVNEIDPSICPPCVNVICAFSDGLKASMKALSEYVSVLGQMLSRNERKLVRLFERDKEDFEKTIRKPERGMWRLRPWKVVLYSAKAWYEKQNGQWTNMRVDTGKEIIGLELPAERADVLLRWARGMVLANESAVVDVPPTNSSSSSSSSSESEGSQHDWMTGVTRALDDVHEATKSSPEKTATCAADEAPDAASDAPPRLTYDIAIAELKDMDHMYQLQIAAFSLKERYWVHSQGYKLRELKGYKGQPVELQVVYGKERYPARVFTTKDDRTSTKTLGRPVFHNARSPETLELMTAWFSNCVENHPECSWSPGDSEMDPILPSRVIDIGDGSSPNFVPRILRPGNQRGKWATLSHRWGQVDFLKTVSENVEELEAGIKVSELPATFQDAIFLTKHLGLRYLWIDSLCIIQDSPQDWLKEAASMPNIYRNSYITIATAATGNSTGGIFVDRSWLPSSRPCKLPVQVTSAESHGMVHLDVPFDAKLDRLETNYLRSRAWCIQESLLSHRLLTFDTLQVSYTCVREGLVESRETPRILAREERNKFLEQFQGGASPIPPNDSNTLRRMIISWYDIVYDYTRRDLTFSNDKLVAISGIASIVGTCIQDEYYAGLWRHDMPRALLWSPYEEETLPNAPHKSRLPPIYRAPSWSWASIDSPISCFLCRERLPNPPIVEILDVSTMLVGQDVYGQVREGTLVIRGPLRRAVVGRKSDVWPEQPLIKLDGWVEGDITHGVFDLEWLDEGINVWCLQITAAFGLMLVKAEGQRDLFSRIGVFHLRHTGVSWPVWFTRADVKTVSIV